MHCLLILLTSNLTVMKQMKDRVFLDSNIVIYSYSRTEPKKQIIAAKIISENNSVISTQVLNELVNIVTRKFNFNYLQAKKTVVECCQNNHLHINSHYTIMQACEIASKYKFSFFDSVIISAALEADCTILYSEDMHELIDIENKLSIVNPFR